MFNLCRGCCKKRAFKETADCPGEALATVPLTLPRPLGQWDLGPAEPHFLPHPLPGHGLLFKTKLEKSLAWKGAQPQLQEPPQAGPGDPGSFPEALGSALA